MDAETSEVARSARASAGLVLLQLLLYRFPPLLEVDADGNTPLHYAARYDPGLVDAVMTALGDEWARAATLANRHGHIPEDMLTPAVEHLDAATALTADWDRRASREERDERIAAAATRAEASRNGAARLRSLTRSARRCEAAREAETTRTFDARGFARLAAVAAAAAAAAAAVAAARGGWIVAAAVGGATMWLGVVGETRRGGTQGYG